MRLRRSASPIGAAVLLAGLACGPAPEALRDVVVDVSDRPTGELLAGVTVEQTFVPNHDNLSGVAVLLATYGSRARGCRVVFRLRAADSPNDIARESRDCEAIVDGGWARFDFPALPGTRGQRLTFRVHSPNGRAGEAATIWMSSVPGVYPDGQLSIDGVPTPGALRFVTFHQ